MNQIQKNHLGLSSKIFSYPTMQYEGRSFPPYSLIQIDTENSFHIFTKQNPQDIKTVVIVGAWRGDEVLSFLKYPNAKIFCFEPNPENFSYLQERFKNNSRVMCLPFACGANDGVLELYEGNVTGNDSLLPIVDSNTLQYKTQHQVKVVQLDSILELNDGKIDLLWMDVQGYELEVLKGATDILSRCLAVFSEVNSSNKDYKNAATYEEVTDYLGANYFDLVAEGVEISSDNNRGGNALYLNQSIQINTDIFSSFKERTEAELKSITIKRKLFSNTLARKIINIIPDSLKMKLKTKLKI